MTEKVMVRRFADMEDGRSWTVGCLCLPTRWLARFVFHFNALSYADHHARNECSRRDTERRGVGESTVVLPVLGPPPPMPMHPPITPYVRSEYYGEHLYPTDTEGMPHHRGRTHDGEGDDGEVEG